MSSSSWGIDAREIAESFSASGLRARFVVNPNYDRGQLSSLVAGLAVVDRPGVVAALVTLVDVPLVSADTVRAVIDCYRRTHAPVVRPTSGTRHGHPLLIDRSLFAALRAAEPEAGAKPVVRAHASAARRHPDRRRGCVYGYRHEEDYRKWVSAGNRSGGGEGSR